MIANGSTIDASDLNSLPVASLGLVQDDNEQLPGGLEYFFVFQDLTAAIVAANPERAQVRFVLPCDVLVESVDVEAGDHTAASTTTVTIVGNGAVVDWPITVTGTTGAGATKLPRLLYDNTKTPPTSAADFAKTSQAFRVWPKGTTVIVTVTTTSVAAPSRISVLLVLREFYARE